MAAVVALLSAGLRSGGFTLREVRGGNTRAPCCRATLEQGTKCSQVFLEGILLQALGSSTSDRNHAAGGA